HRAAVRAHGPAISRPKVLLGDRRRRYIVVGVRCVRQVGATPEADQVLRLHLDAAVWAGQDRHLLDISGKPLHSYLTARERFGSRYRLLRWGDPRHGPAAAGGEHRTQ